MLTAVIITYNESGNIVDCIQSLRDVADEVIIVDAESTDDTVKEAEKFESVRILKKQWEGYGSARNYGAQHASHDWIVSVDADERLNEKLVRSIENSDLSEDTVFCMKRINFLAGKSSRFGFLKPEKKPRMYHRKTSEWTHRKVHEQLVHNKKIKESILDGELLHYAYDSVDEMQMKMSGYARLTAEEWHSSGYSPAFIRRKFGPAWHFIRTYLLQAGFLEGSSGYLTSKAAYSYSKKKYECLRALSQSL